MARTVTSVSIASRVSLNSTGWGPQPAGNNGKRNNNDVKRRERGGRRELIFLKTDFFFLKTNSLSAFSALSAFKFRFVRQAAIRNSISPRQPQEVGAAAIV
jgi:hypothetical protein